LEGWILVVVTAVLVGLTGWYAHQTREMVRVTERAWKAQTRPYVVVELDPNRLFHHYYLVIRNTGVTAAHNVAFTIDPQLESTFDSTGFPPANAGPFANGIPTLAPGAELPIYLDHAIDRDPRALQDRYDFTIHYEDDDGEGFTGRSSIDLASARNVLSADRRGDIRDAVKALESIANAIEMWTPPGREVPS
jgi:hypothetical protein